MSETVSCGTRSHFIIVSSPAQNKTINSTVMSAVNANDKKIPFFIFSVFFFPYAIAINALLPRHNPMMTDVKKIISVYDAPTAASALLPIHFPTTHVSARL